MSDMHVKAVVNALIEGLGSEILRRSVANLGSTEFSNRAPILASEIGSPVQRDKKKSRNWTTTNNGILARSGKFTHNRGKLEGEVRFDAPYAYFVNYGAMPHTAPFNRIYEWAWKRKKEILAEFPDLNPPKDDKVFWKMKDQYVTGRKVRTQAEKMVRGKVLTFDAERQYQVKLFTFAYMVWRSIQKYGVEPNFYFSDAVYQTWQDRERVIKYALRDVGGIKVES